MSIRERTSAGNRIPKADATATEAVEPATPTSTSDIPAVPDDAPSPDDPAAATASADAPASAPSSASKKKPKLGPLAIAAIVLTVVAIAGWTAFGVTLSSANATADDLDGSQASVAKLSSDKKGLESDLADMTTSRDSYKDSADSVTAREGVVKGRENAVKVREDAAAAAEQHVRETTLADGSVYSVDVSMQAGVYEATSTNGRCYWEITRSGSNYGDIVQNDLGKTGVMRVTVSGGQDFQSHSCGNWTKVG